MNSKKNRTKGIFSFVFLVMAVFSVPAQQEAQFSQYLLNTVSINPAFAGVGDAVSIFGVHRSQWVGIDGAPVTDRITFDTPLDDYKYGLAFSVVSDKIGPSTETSLSADFAYNLVLSDTYQLAFGLKASAGWLNVDFTKLGTEYTNNDFVFQNNIDNRFTPNVGVGFYLYSDKAFVSLSAPNLLQTKYFDRSNTRASSYIAKSLIHYYLQMRYDFDVNEDLKLTPLLFTRYVQGSPLRIDLGANFTLYDTFSAALSTSLGDSTSLMLGFQISDKWFIGSSYDMNTSGLAKYKYNSFEILLKYNLFEVRRNRIF